MTYTVRPGHSTPNCSNNVILSLRSVIKMGTFL